VIGIVKFILNQNQVFLVYHILVYIFITNIFILITKVDIQVFIAQAEHIPTIDVRSPCEYMHAHFPKALNLPLLNNEERATVGTTYKHEGNQTAVLKGYELVGYKFADYIKQAIKMAPHKKINIYCWRGGLRSNILAFVLHSAGFEVNLLQGGYKKYRQWVLEILEQPKQIKIVGGKTGSGKTYVLHELEKLDQQIIDLEGLAKHKGSAFGSLGQAPQPSIEMFENNLAMQWAKVDSNITLWLENESRMIGTVRIPPKIYEAMRQAMVYDLQISLENRIAHIAKEYGTFEKQLLADCTKKLEKKMGNLRMQQALDFLYNNELNAWIFMLLEYYDKAYLHSKEKRNSESIIDVDVNSSNFQEIAKMLLAI
jgi:tRNA 2-selenouridine synthase